MHRTVMLAGAHAIKDSNYAPESFEPPSPLPHLGDSGDTHFFLVWN